MQLSSSSLAFACEFFDNFCVCVSVIVLLCVLVGYSLLFVVGSPNSFVMVHSLAFFFVHSLNYGILLCIAFFRSFVCFSFDFFSLHIILYFSSFVGTVLVV